MLVVDGGGSMNCALFGGNLAKLAAQNGWAGIIIHGCVRDRAELAAEAVGIKALASHPKKAKSATSALTMSALIFRRDHPPRQLDYADEDGVIVSDRELVD